MRPASCHGRAVRGTPAARWFAHLLRLGVFPQGYLYPKTERAVRDLLRKRVHLVRQHTSGEAHELLTAMRQHGYIAPMARIAELLSCT